ncbi:MAG: LysE family translocator [Pseudomonadota bacterium]
MLTFAAAVFFLIITPGPGVLTTAGVGSGFGYRAGARFLAGLCIGTNLVQLLVATGLTAIVFAEPSLRAVLLLLSVAWFIYLASKIAFAGTRVGFIESETAPGFLDGVILQFINPKAYAVSNLLISGYAFWPDDVVVEIALKFVIMNLVWIPVHVAWLTAGVMVRRMELSAGTQRVINLGMATALLIVVFLAAWSELTR